MREGEERGETKEMDGEMGRLIEQQIIKRSDTEAGIEVSVYLLGVDFDLYVVKVEKTNKVLFNLYLK